MSIVSAELAAYLDQIANIIPSDIAGDDGMIYVTKVDGSYLTRVGMEDDLQWMLDKGITDEIQSPHKCACVGFNPETQRWYGWSHRARYGFTVGSTCKKGDCHYEGSDLKEQEEGAIRFWKDEYHSDVRCEGITTDESGERFFDIRWEYLDTVPNKSLRGTTGGTSHHIKPLGKGEWTAKTLADAYQMACDFAEGVS